MSRIFLSHSSNNNAEAIALCNWLKECGWDDVFLDLDPERGLKAGERWQLALKKAAERCELVIFLVSPAWVESKWCLTEFLLAKTLNKRIFAVVVEPTPFSELPPEMTSELLVCDLTMGLRDAMRNVTLPNGATAHVAFASKELGRLRFGLQNAGLDPHYFAWPPDSDRNRIPYRGLKTLETVDAGIFFGRDGPIVLCLDMLRGLRETPAPRLLVILGASGAGKSSFVRAGLIPRLMREDQHFLTLPVLRPERAVLTGETGFITCLEQALRSMCLSKTRAEIRNAIDGGAKDVTSLLFALQSQAQERTSLTTKSRVPPTLILPVDQAEELFLTNGASEAEAFLGILADLAKEETPALIVLFTIRSDNYERLQTTKYLEGLCQRTFSLPPMPIGSYADVIKGPARRFEGSARALKMDEQLVDALLNDIQQGDAKDALPLLAFTLEQLYCEYGGDGDLNLSEYEQFGRLKGSIEAAVEQAFKSADLDSTVPRDRTTRLALLRRGLVPWLAGIDPETGSPRRRIAHISEIPTESRPLILHLVDQRLLSTDVAKDTGEKTIEPAHEALLRQWPLLKGWLATDSGLLVVLDGVKRSARDWMANHQNSAWLTHAGRRLKSAENLLRRIDLADGLDATDRDYLEQCRRKMTRRFRSLAGVALVACIIAYAVYDEVTAREALRQTARQLILDGRPIEAGPFALAGMADKNSIRALFPTPSADEVLRDTGLTLRLLFALTEPESVYERFLTKNGQRLLVKNFSDEAFLFDTATGRTVANFGKLMSWIVAENGKLATIKYPDHRLVLFDLESGKEIVELAAPGQAKSVYHNEKSNQVAVMGDDNSCKFFPSIESGNFVGVVLGPSGSCAAISLKDSPPRVIVKFFDGTGAIRDENGDKLFDLTGKMACSFCDISKSGDKAYAHSGAHVEILDIATRTHKGIDSSAMTLEDMQFSPSGKILVTRDSKNHVALWDTTSAEKLQDLGVFPRWKFTPGGKFLLTYREDDSGSLWRTIDGAQVAIFQPGGLSGFKFSDHDDLVIRSSSGKITFIDKNELIRDLPGIRPSGVNVSKDGSKIAVSSKFAPGYLWDVVTWRKITDFDVTGADDGPSGDFSTDGSIYVTQSSGQSGSVWDTNSGQMLGRLGGPSAVYEFSIANDASVIVSESNNSRIAIWSIDKKLDYSSAALRQHVCSLNYRYLDFNNYKAVNDQGLKAVADYLAGKKSNPCDWEGLLSLEGWRQFFENWSIKILNIKEYVF